MNEFKESKFYKLLQDFFINNDKETFLQMLAEFYNKTEGIIIKNEMQDEIIKELREMFLLFNEEGIDENIVREKVNYFLENSEKIQDIITKIIKNTNNIKNISSRLEQNTKKLENIINVKEYGMVDDGLFDNISIFNNLKSQYPNSILYFPIQSPEKTYYFSGVRPNLGGVLIKTDKDVIFKLDVNPNLKEMSTLNDIVFENTTHLTKLKKPKNIIDNEFLFSISSALTTLADKELIFREKFTENYENKIYTPNDGEISINGTAIIQDNLVVWGTSFLDNPQILKPKNYTNNSLYEISLSCSASANLDFGFFVKTVDSVYLVLLTTNAVTYRIVQFNLSGDKVKQSNYTLPNGAYGLITGGSEEINLGISYVNNNEIHLLVNDFRIACFNELIIEVGFDIQMNNLTNTFKLKNPIKTINYINKIKKPLKIALIGDSISFGAWNTYPPEKILKLMLSHTQNVGTVDVVNYSVSGYSSNDWLLKINEIDFNGYDYAVINLGTNDIQGNIPVDAYISNLTTIANKIKSYNCKVVFNVFSIFTTSSKGVNTQNYGKHCKYTNALKIFCLDNNYLYGNVRRNVNNNLSLLGDNIHLTDEGQIEHCLAIVEVINRDIKRNL